MAYPTGVALVAVTAGSAINFAGVEQRISVEITPVLGGNATRLIWAATGQLMIDGTDTYAAEAGGIVSFAVPNPDQSGFIDGTGNAVRNWSYRAKVTVGGRTWNQSFQPVAGQITIDLDMIPDGQTTAPTSAPVPAVTSVNGQTGAVVVQGGGGGGASDEDIATVISDETSQTNAAIKNIVEGFPIGSGVVVLQPGEELPDPVIPGILYLRVVDDPVDPTGAPTITLHPQDVTVEEGSTASFPANATDYDTFVWQHLINEDAWEDMPYIQETTMELENVSTFDYGRQFRCAFTNAHGTVHTDVATLRVTESVSPPTITQHPADITVEVGDTYVFMANATGYDSLVWQYMELDNWVDMVGYNNTMLEFAEADMANNGIPYRCAFTNANGTVYTDAATATINEPTPVEPGTIVRTLNVISTPGEWSVDSGTLVTALGSVDEVYTYSSNLQTQFFGSIANPDVTEPISAVRVVGRARLAEPGSRVIAPAIRVGGTSTNHYHPDGIVLDSTEWVDVSWTYELSPETSQPWTAAEVNGISRVYMRVNNTNGDTVAHLDYMAVEIDYGG